MTNPLRKKTGLLLVNLGTPLSPSKRDVFNYLNEFLTDERVIDIPLIKRQLLVRGVIVPFRFMQSAEQYKRLWEQEGGSPLLLHSLSVEKALQESLGESYTVALAMRYQYPSIKEALEKLKQAQVDEIITLPLFPQYASATTGSVYQEVMRHLSQWLVIPKLTFIDSFYDHPDFIAALCARVSEHSLKDYDHVLMSFHGLPERHIVKSDQNNFCLKENCCQSLCQKNRFCYKAQCFETARLIAQQLSISSSHYTVCFQSRLGKEPWIQPYASDTVHNCAVKGYKKLLVLSPAFVCDCLETLFEIACEYKQEFIDAGGEDLTLVTGLNDHPLWIQALKAIVTKANREEKKGS